MIKCQLTNRNMLIVRDGKTEIHKNVNIRDFVKAAIKCHFNETGCIAGFLSRTAYADLLDKIK